MRIDVINLFRMDAGHFKSILDRFTQCFSIGIGVSEMVGIGCHPEPNHLPIDVSPSFFSVI